MNNVTTSSQPIVIFSSISLTSLPSDPLTLIFPCTISKLNIFFSYLSIEEFETFIQSAGLLNDMLTSTDVSVCFNLSLFTYVDEITKDHHLKMSYIEFIEAFARIADKASHSPIIPIKTLQTARSEISLNTSVYSTHN